MAMIDILLLFFYAPRKTQVFELTVEGAIRSIISTMADSLIALDPNKMIKIANKASLNLLGYKKVKLLA